MRILTAIGSDSTLTFGYITRGHWKCISIAIAEVFWNTKTKAFGLSIGWPYIASIGIVLNEKKYNKI